MSAKVDTAIRLPIPSDLLEAVDGARGDVPRTVWIRRAIEQRLGTLETLSEPGDSVVTTATYTRAQLDAAMHQKPQERAVEQASGIVTERAIRGKPAPAEQPIPVDNSPEARRARGLEPIRPARASGQAKRDVQPIPKGGRK